jgi:hypothetical protein
MSGKDISYELVREIIVASLRQLLAAEYLAVVTMGTDRSP